MPIPKPSNGESEEEFIGRCMSDEGMAEYEQDQRYAICISTWQNGKRHSALLEAVRSKRASGDFGYGITTADRYVKRLAEESLAGPLAKFSIDLAQAEKDAASKLVFCLPSSAKEATGGIDLLPAGMQAPPNTLMVVRHVVTTPREDRDMDVLHPDGAELDPKSPLLWQHLHTLPIGRVLATVEHNNEVLKVCSCILDLNELTGDVAKLVEADCLRFSHGFIAKEWSERREPGKSAEDVHGGFDVTKYQILEVSLVSVPSNVDAEVELWSRGKLESDVMKAHAKQAFDGRQKVFNLAVPDVVDPPEKEAVEPAEKHEADSPQPSQPPEAVVPAVAIGGEKVGRMLSRVNVDALKDARDDLDELSGMDLPRAALALIERCRRRVDSLISASEDQEAEDEEIDDEDESARPIAKEPAIEFRRAQTAEIVNWILEANEAEQRAVMHAMISLGKVKQRDKLAGEFRSLLGR